MAKIDIVVHSDIEKLRQRLEQIRQEVKRVAWENRQMRLWLDIRAMHQADNTTMTRPRRIPFSAN